MFLLLVYLEISPIRERNVTEKKLARMFLMITLTTRCLTEVYVKYFVFLSDKTVLLSNAGGVTPAGLCFIQDKRTLQFYNQISH